MKITTRLKSLVPSGWIMKSRLIKDGVEFYFLNRIVSPFPSKHVRAAVLRIMGARIAKGVPIYGGCEFRAPARLVVGRGSTIGHQCGIDARRGLIIGENVCLAAQVMIWTLHHDYNTADFRAVGDLVEIGDYAWLGSRCIILPGVKIGRAAVVAAGAVVTKDVASYDVVGGVPAKVIGRRAEIEYDYTPSQWWLPLV